RNTCYPARSQSQRLSDSARHAVVLKGACGIESLVLEHQAVEPGVLRRPGRLEQRRIAFAQRNHLLVVVQEGNHLTVAPNAALFQRSICSAPHPPDLFQPLRIVAHRRILHFKETAAARATVEDLADREAMPAAFVK